MDAPLPIAGEPATSPARSLEACASCGRALAAGRGYTFRAGADDDLMELFRPAVDALVLTFLDRTTFAYGDMVQASNGQCMLHPQLARAVVAGCRLEQERVSEGAQQLRGLLVDGIHCDSRGLHHTTSAR
jgi:hypothetical protein